MSDNIGNFQNNWGNWAHTNFGGSISDDRINGSNPYDGVSGLFQGQPMANSSNQSTWLGPSNDVNAITDLRESDFGNSMVPMGGGFQSSAEQVHSFNNQAAPYGLFDRSLQYPPPTVMGSYTNPAWLLGSSAQTDPMSTFLPPETPIPPTPIHDRSTGDITDEVNIMLLTLRDAGQGYSEISTAIQERFGVTISCNALTKRYSKMEHVRMSALPTAIQISMPEIMGLIERRLTQMDNGSLSETERQRVRELMVDLPNSFPRWVENRLARRGGSAPSRARVPGFL